MPPPQSSFSACPQHLRIFHFFLFLLIVPSSSSSSISSYAEQSDFGGVHEFIPLRREKRAPMGVANEDLLDMNGGTFPPDVEVEDENNQTASTTSITEHTYYNMTIYTNQTDIFDAIYVDVAKWIQDGGAEGSDKNDHLAEAYRKAAGVRLKFEFPFYGHRLANLTIATGGFLYVGDQTHSWLAATQYIAPLMANFDTTSNNSSIRHADDGKRMIVEWRNVTLRDNKAAGPFTFQVHLWKNGNITFVYKQVPFLVANISDAQHPCKLGISDAYLFNHKVTSLSHSVSQNKRVIHEYHRITIPPEKITTNSVVMLHALPTCLDATTCEHCINTQLKAFKCSWCNPKDSGKPKDTGTEGGGIDGKPENPFCSDQLGLHRRRQEWIEGNCQLQEENQYCKADDIFHRNISVSSVAPVGAHASSLAPPQLGATPDAIPPPVGTTPASAKPTPKAAETKTKPTDEQRSGGGGLAFITLFMLVGISISVWMLYAYFNPHTRSGQLLIKYRPSKWQIPSSHVRYSASVHM